MTKNEKSARNENISKNPPEPRKGDTQFYDFKMAQQNNSWKEILSIVNNGGTIDVPLETPVEDDDTPVGSPKSPQCQINSGKKRSINHLF